MPSASRGKRAASRHGIVVDRVLSFAHPLEDYRPDRRYVPGWARAS